MTDSQNACDVEPRSTGLLLIGHGTRNQQGRLEFLQTAEMVAESVPQAAVGACFLELAEPDIPAGIAQMVAAGVRSLVVAPMLLFAAGHARQDIPQAVEAAAERFPELKIRQCDVLGCHAAMLAASAGRFHEAITGEPDVAATDMALLMVGRGSRDASATAEMHRFAKLRAQEMPAATVEVCFMAMASPAIGQGIAKLGEGAARRIVVQPHLLFQGDLLDRLQREVATARETYSDKQWLVAPHLGPSPPVVEAIVARFHEVEW